MCIGVIIIRTKIIQILIIVNLGVLAFVLLGRLKIVHKLMLTIAKAFLIPLLISALLFYITRPLNNIFIKKGLTRGKASLLTLIICTFILSGLLSYFSKYAYGQFEQLTRQIWIILNDKKQIDGFMSWINSFINVNEIYALIAASTKNYIQQIGYNFMRIIGYFMNAFSTVFLIVVIVFYMLKDGDKFKDKILKLIPKRYKKISDEILSESDIILSHYVTGQAKVALALASMIFLGYKIIGMPNALLLSTITFILAFIPFVGFFISMIIPVVIAIGMGLSMFLKLMVLFIIVQTLKGRVVVPAIMAKSMSIHPLTDIFLVIGAIALGGPFTAFAIVPIYAIIKNIVLIFFNAESEA
ncbi:AI-2E family transporter [Clostridium peptidivorans]|uniref:AI-2E family transporter n=1 Tax=Clostridium peptidivorans TaxID=100174 RepID=UPI001FA93F6C|nr:AI-2E family transporter [Clostridium peptidivorans]